MTEKDFRVWIHKALKESTQNKFSDGSYHLLVYNDLLSPELLKVLNEEIRKHCRKTKTSVTETCSSPIVTPKGDVINNYRLNITEIHFHK